MCTAGKITIVEVEELVDEIPRMWRCIFKAEFCKNIFLADQVHVPGIYIQRVCVSDHFEKRIEKRTITAESDAEPKPQSAGQKNERKNY